MINSFFEDWRLSSAADVKWSPDLNEGGARNERVYTVEGKEKLSDERWTSPPNAAHRFFRVKVEMP